MITRKLGEEITNKVIPFFDVSYTTNYEYVEIE